MKAGNCVRIFSSNLTQHRTCVDAGTRSFVVIHETNRSAFALVSEVKWVTSDDGV